LTNYNIKKILIIGSGNWGLALANLFCKKLPVKVWAINEELADQIKSNRDKPGPFYQYPLDSSIEVEMKYSSRIDPASTLIIIAVPSNQISVVAGELSKNVKSPLILTVSKGFDAQQQLTMSDLIKKLIPDASVVVLTGPTIANEVSQGKPTRAVLACDNLMILASVKEALRNDVISFEISREPAYHEICAALKGIVAIAVGLAEGIDLGCNAKGIIMTEGIKELAVVASFFGISQDIAYGTSGSADLIATCISPDSRNVQLGKYLAKSGSLKAALDKVGMAVEGVAISETIEMLWSLDVSIPLIHTVNNIVLGKNHDVEKELREIIKQI
jgi:glycerol-3-phosphate dehydrogenase (NAD(P)+)